MDLGFHFINFTDTADGGDMVTALTSTARAAESAGCAWFTLADHFFQMEGLGHVAEEPFLEGYTTLGFLAAATQRIKLGLLVTGVTHRYPGVLAKTVTTLDVLSRGRAMLGLGAGWYEREHVGLGIPFPPTRERFERLDEALAICRQMWSPNDGPFQGRHYQLAETLCLPQPIQVPAPPILVGGGGEHRTLRLVARYADIWNAPAAEPAGIAHKIEVLARHCEAENRDPATIRRSVLVDIDPLADPDGFLAAMQEYAALGISVAVITTLRPNPADFLLRLGDYLIPRLRLIDTGTAA